MQKWPFMRFPDTHSKLISFVHSSWILTVLWEEQRKKVLVKANNIFMLADDVVWGPRTTGEGRNKNMKVEDPWTFEYLNPLSPNSDQHQFSPNLCCQGKWLWEVIKWSLKRKCFVCYQILSTSSLRKCMEISLENLYVDIGA